MFDLLRARSQTFVDDEDQHHSAALPSYRALLLEAEACRNKKLLLLFPRTEGYSNWKPTENRVGVYPSDWWQIENRMKLLDCWKLSENKMNPLLEVLEAD